MRLSVVRSSVALSLVLVLTACSPGASTGREPTATGASQSPTIQAGAIPEFFSTCSDEVGDGADGADITEVTLHNGGSLLFATVQLAENANPSDFERVSFITTAFSADGHTGYQVGTTFSAGIEIANYVFDMTTASQENISNGAVFADGHISVRYPVGLIPGLGDGFGWHSVVAVDGADVDLCGDSEQPNLIEQTAGQ